MEKAVIDAAQQRRLLFVTSKSIRDHLKWIENVEYGILAARLVVAICSPQNPPPRRLARQAPFNKINENVFYELGRAQAVGKPTLILAADVEALPSDVKSLNVLEYDADDVDSYVDKIAGRLHELQDNCENELVDKRVQDVKSLCGVPAALARPEFLAYLGDILYIALEYREAIEMLETYIKNYRDSRARAEQTPGSSPPQSYFIHQYTELTPPMLRALVRKRHLKIASIPDDFAGACNEFRKAFTEADSKIEGACSEINEALTNNFGANKGTEGQNQWIDRINKAVGIVSDESANILNTVHNFIQEGRTRR